MEKSLKCYLSAEISYTIKYINRMKKFFYSDGQSQLGPFTLEELFTKNISRDTLVWFKGLPNWTQAINIPELAEKFDDIPPPLNISSLETQPVLEPVIQTTRKVSISFWLVIGISLIILLTYIIYLNIQKGNPSLVPTPVTSNSFENHDKSYQETIKIDAKKIALRKFDEYSPKIEASKDAAIGNSEAYSGDLNHDGLEDVIVFFVLVPKEGGNALMGQGFAVYVNQRDDMKVVAGFEPDYIFRVEGINNNKIHIIRQDYAENDDPGRPSIETHKYLILNGNKLQESNTF